MNPEIGFEEFETTELIRKELKKFGIEIIQTNSKTGVVGVLKGKGNHPNIVTAIRADIDALPILEETNKPWKSKNRGVMHACGHDGHTAILLGVAKILSTMTDRFSGIVKFIFQPAEEKLNGAKNIILDGALENPKPDTIIALHGGSEVPLGKIGVFSGSFMASTDIFVVKISGKGAHGAYPHRGNDALLAACQAVVTLQSITSREIDAIEKIVVSVCQIKGGSAFNIMPQTIEFKGSVRCHNKEVRHSIEERINRIVGGVAAAYGCTHKLDYTYGIPQVYNNELVIDDLKKSGSEILGADNVIMLKRPLMGSDDFALYLESVKGAMFRLGITEERDVQLHHPEFDFPDEAIKNGMLVFLQYIIKKHSIERRNI